MQLNSEQVNTIVSMFARYKKAKLVEIVKTENSLEFRLYKKDKDTGRIALLLVEKG